MERYKRAYRDPNSPLTPLTPMLGNIFDFNIDNSSQALVPVNQPRKQTTTPKSPTSPHSPLLIGLAALGNFFRRERGHRLGSAPSSNHEYPGKENIPMGCKPSTRCSGPRPPVRQKQGERLATKQEKTNVNIPRIKIEPPPRRKRNARNTSYEDAQVNDEDFVFEKFSDDSEFVRQQQKELEKYKPHKKRRFDASQVRLASPVAPKPLSPRLGAFLASWGMNCLKSIFERQEIDIQTFCCLTAEDLSLLGIDAEQQELVLKAVEFLKAKLQKE